MHEVVESAFERKRFSNFLESFLPDDYVPYKEIKEVPLGNAKVIREAYSLGECPSLGGLQVFEIVHERPNDPRVKLASEAFRIMASTLTHKALVVFRNSKSTTWRLSLMTVNLDYDESKNRIVNNLSNPRRYSYILGENSKTATPRKFLIKKGKVKSSEDLIYRFSAEVVNNEFYQEIAKLYDELAGTEKKSGILKHPVGSDASHQFAVRLIGRIVFCWFLREKESTGGIPLISSKLLSLEAAKNTSNYYHDVLAPLFFEVLNKSLYQRSSRFTVGDFAKVPYLNGGLFAHQKEDFYSFDKKGENSIPDHIGVPDEWLHQLFELLERYHFTVDENTTVDIDLSIDPEMLGRIFENLLARINPETGKTVRKSTGNFYTPRQIVEYMVDESLLVHLQRKTEVGETPLRALISYGTDDDQQYPLTQKQKQSVVDALYGITILDPACGSGAFPMGALQKIVYILSVVDPDAKYWKAQQFASASPELRRHLEKENFNYIRKLGVIRESIFGVDIQPIATEIARLRCFLTLVVDQNVDDSVDRGVKPLPNLDFKFVTANSLINAPEEESDEPSLFGSFADQLAEAVDDYFSAEGHHKLETLNKLRDLIDQKVHENIDHVLSNQGLIKGEQFQAAYKKRNQKKNNKLLEDAEIWKSYKNIFQHHLVDFFETKYFFPNVKDGFDVIIGNPPYISALSAKKIIPESTRKNYKSHYVSAKGAYDMYLLFFERGLELMNSNGVLTYISPTKYVSAKYAESFRGFLGENHLLKLADFSNSRVFESAGVSTLVTLLSKNLQEDPVITEKYESRNRLSAKVIASPRSSLHALPENLWGHLLTGDLNLLEKIINNSDLLSTITEVNGSSTANEADRFAGYVSDKKTPDSLKMVNTGNMARYYSLWGIKNYSNKKKKIATPYLDLSNVGERRIDMYKSPKIIIAKLSKSLTAMLDADGQFASTNTTFVYEPIEGVRLPELTAILNSRLMNFVYKTMFSGLNLLGSFQFQAPQIRLLPITKSLQREKDLSAELSAAVAQLQERKNEDNPKNITDYEKKIDDIIYRLYDLTPKEVETIEAGAG